MKNDKLWQLSRVAGSSDESKKKFRSLAVRTLGQVRNLMELTTENCQIRWNAGGTAVSGDATLHGDRIYIQVSGISLGILVRSCSGRKDYTGGRNHWMSWQEFADHGAQGLASFALQILARESAAIEARVKMAIAPAVVSYAPEVQTGVGTSWCGNALRFATRAEAEANVTDLMQRWYAVTDTRVVESADPVNYVWSDGKLSQLDKPETAHAPAARVTI